MSSQALEGISSCLDFAVKDLAKYLSSDKEREASVLSLLKQVFEYNKKDEIISGRLIEGCPLVQLETDGFDFEQLWQQIQLQNETALAQVGRKVKYFTKEKDAILLYNVNNNNNFGFNDYDGHDDGGSNDGDDHHTHSDSNDDDVHGNHDGYDGDDFLHEELDENNDGLDQNDIDVNKNHDQMVVDHHLKRTDKFKEHSSIVDDQFFKLSEMERFLEIEDKRAEMQEGNNNDDNDDDDGIDLFMDYNNVLDEDDDVPKLACRKDASDYMYEDYFDNPSGDAKTEREEKTEGRSSSDSGSERDSDNESDEELQLSNESGDDDMKDVKVNKSTFEQQQEQVKKKIAQLEDSNVSAKPWQLVGEASASFRPANSLLEEMLYFDHTTAPTPVMTEEVTVQLEDIIKQRIKDQTWDDVERKEKPVKEPYVYVKNKSLDQEKSKMSLSEIYEKEYLAQQAPVTEQPNESHSEIEKMMTALFSKLDALSNFHFTPKPLKPEVTIIANVGSVAIEESTPVTVSETTLLAPEEIFEKEKRDLKGASEKTKEDRNQERRLKKKRQHSAAKRKTKKGESLNFSLGNKYTKEKVKKIKKGKHDQEGADHDKKALTSSSAFFAKLQDNVRNEINEKKSTSKKRKNTVRSTQVKL